MQGAWRVFHPLSSFLQVAPFFALESSFTLASFFRMRPFLHVHNFSNLLSFLNPDSLSENPIPSSHLTATKRGVLHVGGQASTRAHAGRRSAP